MGELFAKVAQEADDPAVRAVLEAYGRDDIELAQALRDQLDTGQIVDVMLACQEVMDTAREKMGVPFPEDDVVVQGSLLETRHAALTDGFGEMPF